MRALKECPRYTLQHVEAYDASSGKERAREQSLATRNHMLKMGIDVFSWPLFDVRVTHTSETSSCVHIAVSLFLMDAMSDLIFRQELSALYRAGPSEPIEQTLPPPPKILFKDYCIALSKGLPQSERVPAR